jgi:hypothetical protein
MRLATAQSLLLFVTATLTVIPTGVLASFHIVSLTTNANPNIKGLLACVSSQYDCSCFEHGRNGAPLGVNGHIIGTIPHDPFYVSPGLCNQPQLNFYRRADNHDEWEFYQFQGNGVSLGNCTWNRGTKTKCPTSTATELLVCLSSSVCPEEY